MGLPTPKTRKERYLNAIATRNAGGLPTPITREEEYLDAIAKSGGGGGTTNYNALDNKPQIAGTTLQGNKSLADLGIAGEDAIADVYAVIGEMGAKNLNKFPYKNGGAGATWSPDGITYTVNADGTLDVNGTATADAYFRCGISTDDSNPIYLDAGKSYILSGSGSADINIRLRNSDNIGVANADVTDTLYKCTTSGKYYILVMVKKNKTVNHYTVKPMLRLASDTDNTYQPYTKTNKQLTDEIANKVDKVAGKGLSTNDYSDTEKGKVTANAEAIEAMVNVNGGKNLLPFFVISNVIEGVTWTVDNVNNIITVDGTATNWSYQEGNKNTITLKAGQKYILSSGVDISNQYNVYVDMYDASTISQLVETINGDIEYTPPTDKTVYFNVVVRTGTTVSNVEIKPMIRDARIKDPTYVPYAMTNRELTERVDRGSVSVTADSVKTWAQLLGELYASADLSKITYHSKLVEFNGLGYIVSSITAIEKNKTYIIFICPSSSNANGEILSTYQISSSGYRGQAYSGAEHDISSQVVTSGNYLTLYY